MYDARWLEPKRRTRQQTAIKSSTTFRPKFHLLPYFVDSLHNTLYNKLDNKPENKSKVYSKHWRRQLWGTGARAALDFQLVNILREQIRKMYKNNAIFAQFLSIFGPFLSFFCPQFSWGSNYSSQNRSPINFHSTHTSDSGKTGS